jgi:hypothetical protein
MNINGAVKTFNRLASIKKVYAEGNKEKDCKDDKWFFEGTFSPHQEDLLSNRLREHKYMGEEYQRIMYDLCVREYTNRPFDPKRDMIKPSYKILFKQWLRGLLDERR